MSQKIRVVLSLFFLATAAACAGYVLWTAYMVLRFTIPHGGSAAPWVEREIGFTFSAIAALWGGLELAKSYAQRRAADKSIRTNKTIDFLYLRFGGPWLRRLDGSPWHGLKKFDAWTARNVILATRKNSAFADVMEWNGTAAEIIINGAYEGLSHGRIFKNVAQAIAIGSDEREDAIDYAIAEAVEIYTPRP